MSIDLSTCETFDDAMARVRDSMEGRDVIDELVDVQDLIAALCKEDKAAKVGEVVQAVFDAYVYRVAARGYYEHDYVSGLPSATGAAAAVMAK
jgi:hypothetical protein